MEEREIPDRLPQPDLELGIEVVKRGDPLGLPHAAVSPNAEGEPSVMRWSCPVRAKAVLATNPSLPAGCVHVILAA